MNEQKEWACEANEAFDQAIQQGRLSRNENLTNYAGDYMYMGKDGEIDLFKNINTRQYDV